MARGNFSDNMKSVQLRNPADAAVGVATGSALDLGSCVRGVLLVPVGAISAGGVLSLNLQTSDATASGWANVFTAAKTIATQNTLYSYESEVLKKYVRLTSTVATATVLFGASVVGWHAPVVPVA
jgi:hypothetical protein